MARRSNRIANKKRQQEADAAALARANEEEKAVATGEAAEVLVSGVGRSRRATAVGYVEEWTESDRLLRRAYDRRGRPAPAWTAATHRSVGHVGGAVVFAALMMVAWPAFIAALSAVVVMLMVTVGPMVGQAMLDGSGVPHQIMTASSEQFLFGWVLPSIFGLLVAALLTAAVVWSLLTWFWGYSNLLRLGLYAGYGLSVSEDRAERAVRRAVKKAEVAVSRETRRKERDAARASAAKSKAEEEERERTAEGAV